MGKPLTVSNMVTWSISEAEYARFNSLSDGKTMCGGHHIAEHRRPDDVDQARVQHQGLCDGSAPLRTSLDAFVVWLVFVVSWGSGEADDVVGVEGPFPFVSVVLMVKVQVFGSSSRMVPETLPVGDGDSVRVLQSPVTR